MLLLWEIIAYETRNEGLKESESFIKYQEAKKVGEFEWGFFERLVLMCFVCYRSTHQYLFLKAHCNVASLKTLLYHSLIYDGSCSPRCRAGSWRWWRGLASSPMAVVQPALPVYRTLQPRALHPRPSSSFLIAFLKSCGNNSLWKLALAFKKKKPKQNKTSSIFC